MFGLLSNTFPPSLRRTEKNTVQKLRDGGQLRIFPLAFYQLVSMSSCAMPNPPSGAVRSVPAHLLIS